MIDYLKFLEEYGLWPMDNWHHFDFVHQRPTGPVERMEQLDRLRDAVGLAQGLYAYKRCNDWIYVGKASSLFGRLENHYRSSYEPVPGDTKTQKWHRFFSENTGVLTVYWKEVENEKDRRIFELASTEQLGPRFEAFR